MLSPMSFRRKPEPRDACISATFVSLKKGTPGFSAAGGRRNDEDGQVIRFPYDMTLITLGSARMGSGPLATDVQDAIALAHNYIGLTAQVSANTLAFVGQGSSQPQKKRAGNNGRGARRDGGNSRAKCRWPWRCPGWGVPECVREQLSRRGACPAPAPGAQPCPTVALYVGEK